MATFTSKTLIPGQTPIGQNRDGSYIYEEVMSKATTAPKATTPIYTPPTAIAKIPTDGKTNFMPLVTPENARKPNAPVKDTLNFSKRIKNDDSRVIQLREHFDYLKQNNELFLNDKQTDYIKRFKEKYPDYASVPDTILYGKVLLTDPKVQEKYGNIGEKTFMQRLRETPMNVVESLAGGVDTGIERYQTSRELMGNDSSNLGYENLKTALAGGGALLTGIVDAAFGVVGDTLNVVGKPTDYNTSYTEGLLQDVSKLGISALDKAKTGIDKTFGNGTTDTIIKGTEDFLAENPEAKGWLLTAEGLSNLIGLGLFGGGKKVTEQSVKEILKKMNEEILQKSMTGVGKFGGKITTETFEAGMNQGLTGGLLTGAKTTNEWLKQLPDETQKIAKTVEKNVNKNKEVLEGIRNTQTGEKILAKADDFGNDPKDDIARYEDFQPEIDEDGRVHTDRAVENVETKYIAPKGKTVRSLIEAEGKRVSLEEFRAKTLKEIESNIDDIVNYDDWVKYINKSIDSAKKFVDENGTIALEKIDDIKKKVQSQNKYLNPNDTANKALARGARKMIEENVESADIAALNKEIARFYAIRDYLEAIGTGKTIKGGRLGKYSSKFGGQFIGAVAGGLIGGPAGAVVGGAAAGEAADIIKGKLLSSAIKSTGAIGVPESEAFAAARGTLDEAPKLLEGPSGNPTSYPSIYSREAEQLGRGEFPGNNNTQLGDFATPKSVTPVVSGPGSSLAVSVDNGTIDIKKALEQFDKLNPEEKAKALNGSDKLRELVKVTTEIKDIQEFKGDFGYTPPEIIDSLGDNYLNYSPEAKEIIRKGLDKEDLATLQKMNREKAGLPEPVVEEKAKVTETKELPKKVTDLEEEIGMLDDNKGDRSSFVQKYDGADEYGTAGDAYDAVKDMDRFEFEDYASLWKDKDGGGMVPKNETASKIIDDIDGFADKLGISSDDAITLIRDGTGGSRYKENLANFKARYGVAPFQAKKKLAQFKKAWEAGKNPSIDDFLYKSEKTVDFSKPSKEEMAIENSKTPFDDDPVSPLAKKEPTPTETIEEVVTPKETPKTPVDNPMGRYGAGNRGLTELSDATVEWNNLGTEEARAKLLSEFQTEKGKAFLNEIVEKIPKNKDGTITAYRTGKIGGDKAQSYTLSEGLAKTFSNEGTDISIKTFGKADNKDFGTLETSMVKIDPKGIKGYSNFDSEILVDPKFVKVDKTVSKTPQEGKTVEVDKFKEYTTKTFDNGYDAGFEKGRKYYYKPEEGVLYKMEHNGNKWRAYKTDEKWIENDMKRINNNIRVLEEKIKETVNIPPELEGYPDKILEMVGIKGGADTETVKLLDKYIRTKKFIETALEDIKTNKPKPSLPLSQKSEVKYSEALSKVDKKNLDVENMSGIGETLPTNYAGKKIDIQKDLTDIDWLETKLLEKNITGVSSGALSKFVEPHPYFKSSYKIADIDGKGYLFLKKGVDFNSLPKQAKFDITTALNKEFYITNDGGKTWKSYSYK